MGAMPDPDGGPRPLSARSIAASALLGSDVPRLRVAQLVRAGELFGIAGGAMRTALWRMVADGELATDDGWYELAGPLLDRKRRVDDSHAALRRPWDGTWELAVVAAERRPAAERTALRTAARALHLAEVREGVWGRPDNLDPGRLPASRAVLDAQTVRFTQAVGPGDLAGRLFDLDGWAGAARALLARLDGAAAAAGAGGPAALAEGFLLEVAVVGHLQADPLLPDELLPPDWPGDRLRSAYAEHDRAYKRRLAAWIAADTPAGAATPAPAPTPPT